MSKRQCELCEKQIYLKTERKARKLKAGRNE